MKILEFLSEDNGTLSSTRLFAFAIVTSAIIEWQHAIWFMSGIWEPDYMTVGLVAGVLGIKVLQKSSEQKVYKEDKKKEFIDVDDNVTVG